MIPVALQFSAAAHRISAGSIVGQAVDPLDQRRNPGARRYRDCTSKFGFLSPLILAFSQRVNEFMCRISMGDDSKSVRLDCAAPSMSCRPFVQFSGAVRKIDLTERTVQFMIRIFCNPTVNFIGDASVVWSETNGREVLDHRLSAGGKLLIVSGFVRNDIACPVGAVHRKDC